MNPFGLSIAERVRAHGAQLTAAERRVAETVLDAPQTVGFGTVADLAREAKVGAATVVRLSAKLGFDGYTDLQAAVQRELLDQLRPAVERIRTVADDPFDNHAATELTNVERTLTAVDRTALGLLVDRLSDTERPVAVLSGDDSTGVATQFVTQLNQIRPDVSMVGGNQVAVDRAVAVLPTSASVMVIDLRRYERWVLDAYEMLTERGIWSAAFSDRALSPLSSRANVAFDVHAASHGPFDSHVGTLALLNMVAVAVAAEIQAIAAPRLEAIEAAWRGHDSLALHHGA